MRAQPRPDDWRYVARGPSSWDRAGWSLPGSLPQLGQDLAGVEVEESGLVESDLVDGDVVEAGVHELPDRVQVLLRIGAADHAVGSLLLRHLLAGGLEVGRLAQLAIQHAGQAARRPDLMHRAS